MGWSERRDLPADWSSIRLKVFKRDGYRCTWITDYDERCPSAAEECDHIGSSADHSMSNLRSLCRYHHGVRTGIQGAEAKAKRTKKISSMFRRTELHPSDIHYSGL